MKTLLIILNFNGGVYVIDYPDAPSCETAALIINTETRAEALCIPAGKEV
jgi:hypothetical protein